jgi:hypothetical protein
MIPESEDTETLDLDAVETQQNLITVLHDLEQEVEKQNSWQRTFVRGALYGLGTVLGATVLLAIFGSLFALAVDTFGIGSIPIIGPIINNLVQGQ